MSVRIGIIGVSGRGRMPRKAIDCGAEIVCGADISARARDEFQAAVPGAAVVEDYRRLVERSDIDAVFIMSPDHLHEEQAVAALATGKAVYLEKPIAVTIEGADRILQTATDNKATLYVGHNLRFFEPLRRMREIAQSGTIGEIQAIWCRHFVGIGGDAYFKDWHSLRANVTGLLLQKGAHDIDMIHWMAGAPSQRVVGMGKLSVYDRCRRRDRNAEQPLVDLGDAHWPPFAGGGFSPDIDIEDHSMVMMELANGVQASYVQCNYTPDYWRNYTIIGTKGRVENFGDTGACSVGVFTKRRNTFFAPDEVIEFGGTTAGHGGADEKILANFFAVIRGEELPITNPIDARNAVAAGVAATISLREGNRPMTIPPVPSAVAAYFAATGAQAEGARAATESTATGRETGKHR